jgi:hypothetical protein
MEPQCKVSLGPIMPPTPLIFTFVHIVDQLPESVKIFPVAGSDCVFEFFELQGNQGIVAPWDQFVDVEFVVLQMGVSLAVHVSEEKEPG